MENKKLTAVEWLIDRIYDVDLTEEMFEKIKEQALELEKERESHFAETLKGSTQFLEKVISEGLIDNNPLLKAFIEGQIANNNLTLETYGNQKTMSNTVEERLKQSPSHFINRAIEMIKDADINTGLYNGIVSLLQYAKESDEYAKLKTSELEKENESYKSLLDDGVSEVRRLENEIQELEKKVDSLNAKSTELVKNVENLMKALNK